MTTSNKNIFIAGLPRSGTTWVANILGSAHGVRLLKEPDNEKYSFIGRQWKQSLHRFPYASSSQEQNRQIIEFYQSIFNGKYPANQSVVNHALNRVFRHTASNNEGHILRKELRLAQEQGRFSSKKNLTSFLFRLTSDNWASYSRQVVKSVHAGLCLSLIADHFDPWIVLLFRHPANIIASSLELDIKDADRGLINRLEVQSVLEDYSDDIQRLEDPLSKMGFQIGLFYYLWEQEIVKHPSCIIRTHEDLCVDPVARFEDLFNALDLPWNKTIANTIQTMNKPGKGLKTFRVLEDLNNKWKRVLNNEQIRKIQQGYSILPVKHYEDFAI